MTKILKTKRNLYLVEQNEDGSLHISEEENGASIPNVGYFINNLYGGIDGVLSRCVEVDMGFNDYKLQAEAEKAQERAIMAERTAERKRKDAEQVARDYDLLVAESEVIPVTVENLKTVMHYLNGQNWGGWKLPPMSISYSAHQYDCDGALATTITLDEPISNEEYGIRNERRFMVGGKHGYLTNYQRLR